MAVDLLGQRAAGTSGDSAGATVYQARPPTEANSAENRLAQCDVVGRLDRQPNICFWLVSQMGRMDIQCLFRNRGSRTAATYSTCVLGWGWPFSESAFASHVSCTRLCRRDVCANADVAAVVGRIDSDCQVL